MSGEDPVPDAHDRRIGALMGAFATLGTLFALMFLAYMLTIEIHAYRHVWEIFRAAHIWIPILAVFAAITGYRVGSKRLAVLAGHLWFTERPWNAWISIKGWVVVLATAFITTNLYNG